MVIDPMADFVNYQSPYVVSDNNPVLYVDEYGLGIFRAIGNLFSRGAFAVKKLFSGKNCDCSQFQGESLVDAWNQPDFPALSNLFSGSGKKGSGNGSTTKEEPFQGERVTAVSIQPIEFSLPNIKLPNIHIPVDIPPIVPNFEGIPIGKNSVITFNKDISFEPRTDKFMNPTLAGKTLDDLIKTLKEYPELKLVIKGNVSFDSLRDAQTASDADISQANNLLLTRAKAVKRFLIKRGIDGSRISAEKGKMSNIGQKGRTTTFQLINK